MGIITIDLANQNRVRTVSRKKPRREDLSPNFATVIAIDPGGITGWSLMTVYPEALSDPCEKVLQNISYHSHGQVDSMQRESEYPNDGESIAVDDLWAFIESWPEAAIVFEDFILRSHDRSRQLLSPVRIMARLDYLLWKHKRFAFRQQPADAKTTCSDERLKSWGMYDKHGSQVHARDADRHALLFLRKAKADQGLREDAWPHLFGEDGSHA